jgi:phage shock protein A
MNHLGDTNKMVDTPRTNAVIARDTGDSGLIAELASECSKMERELNAAHVEIERLTAKVAQLYEGAEEAKQRIKRLEEAGDRAIENSYYPDRVKVWHKAKEAKL